MNKITKCGCEFCIVYERFLVNAERIRNAILGVKDDNSDGIRLLIPFVHSVFEDTLRGLLFRRYENGNDKWTSDLELPLVPHRKNKYTLGELRSSYGKETTIKQLLDSAAAHEISNATFNGPDQIAAWLTRVEFDVEPIRKHFANLKRGIDRRHKVVHEADLDPDTGAPRPIIPAEVARYFISVSAVILILQGQAHNKALAIEDSEYYDNIYAPFLQDDW